MGLYLEKEEKERELEMQGTACSAYMRENYAIYGGDQQTKVGDELRV